MKNDGENLLITTEEIVLSIIIGYQNFLKNNRRAKMTKIDDIWLLISNRSYSSNIFFKT